MSIESLAKLTLFYTECKERNITIHSEEFMNDTKELIDKEIEILQKDGAFMMENPGPHVFGIDDFELHIFPPALTGESRWAASIVKGETERTDFMFSSIYGLIEILISLFTVEEQATLDENTEDI